MSENRVYPQWNSHLVGIMISKTIGWIGVHNIFRQTHVRGLLFPLFPLTPEWKKRWSIALSMSGPQSWSVTIQTHRNSHYESSLSFIQAKRFMKYSYEIIEQRIVFHSSPSINTWVCLKMSCTPIHPMVFMIIIPMKNGYFIGNIPNIFRQTHIRHLNPLDISRHGRRFWLTCARAKWICAPPARWHPQR